MSSPTTLLLSLKILSISVGAISIATAIRFYLPSLISSTSYNLPLIWNSLLTWLKPPYLYFIINGIIITIAASSRFNHHHHRPSKDELQEPLTSVKTPEQLQPAAEMYPVQDKNEEAEVVVELKKHVVVAAAANVVQSIDDVADDDWRTSEECKLSQLQKIDSLEAELDSSTILPVKEKPLLSSRFGHKKSTKTSPEGGRALRVARPKRQETLENTWKMITEGRHVPLTRHLKKSDTLENHFRAVVVDSLDHDLSPQHVPKSETFNDRTNYDIPTMPPVNFSPILGKIKKEPSLSQEELNRRVEAFIKKFNEEMRLQRQESLNQYMEMINRGAY